VSGRSVSELARVVSAILSDTSARQAMGERGREWVSDVWSWETTVSDFTAMLAW